MGVGSCLWHLLSCLTPNKALFSSAKPTGKTARVISQVIAQIHAHSVTDWKAITIAYIEKVSWLFKYIWEIFVCAF